jgi:hypothetical protein
MADRYWVGGSGTWDATTTTNWATSSGGAGGASAPTSADNAYFNGASDTGAPFTVTMSGSPVCADLIIGDGTTVTALDQVMTLAGTAISTSIHGSLYFPATNLTRTFTGAVQFPATSGSYTITTNGVTLSASASGNAAVWFNAVTSTATWTLGSALTISVGGLLHISGTFDTANYNITVSASYTKSGSSVATFNAGSSTITLSGTASFNYSGSNLTFNAGTSSIVSSAASSSFTGGGLTFYNVSFTSAAAGTSTITGANTFNDLNQTSRSATGLRIVSLGDNQTVSGTLTLGAANTAIRRILVASNTIGTQRTITLNGTLAALADVDFRNISAAGTVATPWTGTRLGNALGNANITFVAGKNCFRVGTGNWSATQWSLTSGGSLDVNNFPLAQDTMVFDTNTVTGTHTIDASGWQLGSLNCSALNVAVTIASGSISPTFIGNITLDSDVTLTGTGTFDLRGQGTTQTITSAGVTFTQPITIDSPTGTVQLLDNLTSSNAGTAAFILTSGTLDLNEFNLSVASRFTSTNTNVRSIDFGSAGKILLTYAAGGAGLTILSMGDATNFSYSGNSHIEASGNNTAGTRSIGFGSTGALATEAQVMNVFVSAGSDIVAISSQAKYKNLNFTGFSGTLELSSNTIYGNVILSSTMNTASAGGTWTFAATSGTQEFTSNGVVLQRSVLVNAPSATFQLQDNLTIPSTAIFTLTEGTLDLSSGNRTLSTGIFSSTNSNTRSIAFGTGNITLTGNATIVWSTSIATNFSYTGTPIVNFTYAGSAGTRTIVHGATGGATEANSPTINFTAGSDTIATTNGSSYKNLNFTGFTGSLNNGIRTLFGNLTFSSGMTCTAGTNATTFAATSGTQLVTTNGNTTIDFPFTQNGVGGTVQLQDNLTIPVGRTFTLTNGTLDIDGKVLSVGNFSSSNSNTRVIDFGTSGELIVAGVGTTAFNAGTSTGLSITGTNAEINMSGSTAKTFAGGGFTYPLTLNQGGLGDLTITGANTFNDMTNTVQPCTIIFPASTTNSFYNFNVNGTDGNLVLLRSSTLGTRYTLARLV